MKTVLYPLAMSAFLCLHAQTLGATHSVEILRDPWGTPHIFAEAEVDGFFGLGCTAAEDRLLQMELIRRKAAGRLAEVFGPDWVDADREARIAGHAAYAPRAFVKLPERWQEALRAYAAGVNAWREANSEAVARRFRPLGIQPEPWTPSDCLLAARGLLSLGSPFSIAPVEDYHRFRELVAQVGETEAAQRSGMTIDDAVAIVPESEMARDKGVYERLKQRPRMPGFDLRSAVGEEPRKMSHAWAVSGRRSTTGKPILESDPQLPLSSPPFFYEFHLAAGRIDARGLGIAGCPGLFIGWNRRIAWGASALGTDSHVIYLDRLASDRKGYLVEDKAVPFERRLERIEVKGGQPVIQEVLTSRHGTVFNSLVRQSRAGEAYLCYDAQTMDDGASARMMLEVLDARNWTEFRQALEHYYYPGLHIVYADVDGNIGYHTLVHRPLTARSPRRALEGWTGRDEVRGRIPIDELPHLFNPESGFVSHANNLPVGGWYPYDLGLATGGTGDTSRSLRLRQLLEGDRKFSLEDFEFALHRDDVNPLVAALLPVARQVVEEDKVKDPAVLGLLDAVKGWDLHDGTTDRFPAAGNLRNTLTPYRGAGLQNVYGAGGGGVSHLARDVGARFARDGSTPTNALVRAYLVNWLRASAAGVGTGRGGSRDGSTAPISAPRDRAVRKADHTITIPYQRTIPHNLPVVDPSLDFVSPPLTCLDQGTIWSQPGNLYSQIVDLSDVDNSRSMMAPGNSEDGRFRTNQVDLWVKGATRPAPLSQVKLEALGVARTKWDTKSYAGLQASPARTVAERDLDRGARFVPAIPPAAANTNAEAKPLPGRKPDDPTLEAALRVILRQGTPPEEADVQLARCRDYVRGNASLTEQLRSAAVLGVYLIEESAAGRLKVPYGSPHVLEGLRALLKELGESDSSDRRGLRGVQPEEASQPRSPRAAGQPEVWLCAGERIADLLRPEAEWSFVKQHLSGFKLYVDQINTAPPEQLAALVSLAKEHHYRIAIELGGCLDFAPMDDTAGEWSARHELAKIEKWYAAGGQVDFLDLDGPIRRLMHPENRQDGQHFDSIERAVDELVDALRLHRQAHPKTRFWLLTNFPNWGYRGDVSYHARGPQRQDYGDYDAVIGVVLRKLRAAEIPLAGVTVDNPYGYLMGVHPSVNLKDPKSVNWLKRVRSYEDFAREQGLEFNLIVNSERGGNESDERFHRETLAMVDTYRDADGRPTRWFVQSWYPYPKQIVPETAPHSMAALVKAVIERVNPGEAMPTHRPAPVDASAAQHGPQNDLGNSGSRIVLQPQPGAMQVTARVPALDNQAFALGIPETIGCREAMLVNFPEAKIEWQGPDRQGVVSCSWGPGGRISYTLRLIPAEDYVDVEMTIRNHTEFLWHDVFAFNCLNPILAPVFQDWKLERTYMSAQGKPLCMAKTSRVKGHMPTVGFYLPERIKAGEESVFVRGFGATSPDRTDGSWIVTLSDAKSAFMAATAFEAAFLFDNLDRCCLHAAPSFGDIGPGESSTTVSRFYLAQGTLDDFLKRQEVDSPGLVARQKWARGAKSAVQPPGSRDGALAGGVKSTDETRPRRRMEDTPDKPSFEQYLRKAALSREVIDRFLRGPSWAQFDAELGYILGNYLPSDGMDGSATLSTVQANGARTSFVYAGRKCRINTYGDSFTQCHQVSDAETWQEYLAGHLGEPIRNFGMGGYGVYQAYRRMVREERTDHAADYVIFYIWGDDHIRSLLRCRHAIIYPWWDHQGGRMFHNNFWPNLELDLQTGQFVEKENLLRTRDSLYRMTDPEWMVETLRDDLALELFAFRQGLIRDLDRRRIDPLAARLGFSIDWDRRSTLQAQAGELLDRYSLRATRFVLDKTRAFARENHKKLLVVLFDPSRAMAQMRRSETRYDQEIVDYLTKEQFNYFDMNEVQLRDFKKSNRPYEDYQRQYFIGHYSPRGNHFFAYSIKDVAIKWLDPKPITYRAPDPQLIDFGGYLPDAP